MSNETREKSEKGQGSGQPPAGQSSTPAVLRWLLSSTYRHARAMRKHVHRLRCAQRDILPQPSLTALDASLSEMDAVLRSDAGNDGLKKAMETLEKSANKWLKPYPNAAWRENVEVLLVAIAVAMAIRTFFIQPFKIPTGSMEPTLFGVESTNLINDPGVKFPTGFDKFDQWVHGISWLHVVAENDGPLEAVEEPVKILIFSIYQRINIGGHWQTIWFPPDYGAPPAGSLRVRAGLHLGLEYDRDGSVVKPKQYFKGDDVVKLRLTAGDYLFVDRFTFNFRKPQRGEIIVFATSGIAAEQREPWRVPDDQFYIKRLVGLGGENMRIGDDSHLIIDGKRLDASTPGFARVYSYDPNSTTNLYFGHTPIQRFANGAEFNVPPNHFLVMGDNTHNSLDSRFFGDVDANAIIGRASFVYWPITDRSGFGYR